MQKEKSFSNGVRTALAHGTNTRLRVGIANCLEVLADAPTYFANVSSPEKSGFSDPSIALRN